MKTKAPGRFHNNPPSMSQMMFVSNKKKLREHTTHNAASRAALHAFLVGILDWCKYAKASDKNAKEVEADLLAAGAPHLKSADDWMRPMVVAHYDKADRTAQKTNISKYVSVCHYGERKGGAAALRKLLDEKSIAEIAHLEAEARAADKVATATSSETAFDAAQQHLGNDNAPSEPDATLARATSADASAEPEVTAPTETPPPPVTFTGQLRFVRLGSDGQVYSFPVNARTVTQLLIGAGLAQGQDSNAAAETS